MPVIFGLVGSIVKSLPESVLSFPAASTTTTFSSVKSVAAPVIVI